MGVRRIYVEKKEGFGSEAGRLLSDIGDFLGISGVSSVRVLTRYDVEGVSDTTWQKAVGTIFSEPPVDMVYEEKFESGDARVFGVEALPGQFDQRADSACQCVSLIDAASKPVIMCATIYCIYGNISDGDFERIKSLCINPVDSGESSMDKPDTLIRMYDEPDDVEILTGFCDMSDGDFKKLYDSLGLAMTYKDFEFIRAHFKDDLRKDPTITEIRVLDTYWSDHCRHTTFATELKNVEFGSGKFHDMLFNSFQNYVNIHKELFADRKDKPLSLMDLGTIGAKKLKSIGKLDDLEPSDEVNACSIVVPVTIDGKEEEWLVSFKNETHNHPTEIEPFGGAATCLGGCIRDPLSGRSYVCQAMRITGAADPTKPMDETLSGKLPQKKIVQDAAAGYSSYGNQIGLATGYVKEIYHPNYVAKRMEVGAVVGAARRSDVVREHAAPGDVVILLGGRTGRDGIGGATGASKVHDAGSLSSCGAEVQKGNPPTERKIQRMFRRPEVTRLIKICNDFGAGGVSVAIGELADGLDINLDLVPRKYAGLDGTEIAISESQERMAVVVDASDEEKFLEYAAEENLEAVRVAVVTKEPVLKLSWRGKTIVELSRAFLDTNGASQETDVKIELPDESKDYFAQKPVDDVRKAWLNCLSDLNECSQKGLVERFDSSIGAGSVLMPYGGKYQRTETQAMVSKLPVLKGKTDTVTLMSYGFDPYLSSWSPYHGAVYAVIDSAAKIVAAGGDYSGIRLSFQEYFKRMTADPTRWGQPVSALLGALDAQLGMGLPAIGGKDSMSGTFDTAKGDEINVPPTLISFAVAVGNGNDIISPELKNPGNELVLFGIETDENEIPVYPSVKAQFDIICGLIKSGVIKSAYALGKGGLLPAVSKMAFGNALGVKLNPDIKKEALFAPSYGQILCEVEKDKISALSGDFIRVGEVTAERIFSYGNTVIDIDEALKSWEAPLDKIFPSRANAGKEAFDKNIYEAKDIHVCKNKAARPKVFIPVFPGTNCEYDSARAFEKAGAEPVVRVFKNMTSSDIDESVKEYEKIIKDSQIVMFPGGFSAGDEPEGSAKFFASVFRNERLADAIEDLLDNRDGLMLGICNGFQALIKLGLLPYGHITPQKEDSPTLTYNTVGRHISKMVYTKVVSNKSPWLSGTVNGDIYVNPASHGEGRFVAADEWLKKLFDEGMVATRYVDADTGLPTMDEEWNVNGSYMAIEGITSADGRIYGKMAHAERIGDNVAKNIYGNQDMKLFESGVKYFA